MAIENKSTWASITRISHPSSVYIRYRRETTAATACLQITRYIDERRESKAGVERSTLGLVIDADISVSVVQSLRTICVLGDPRVGRSACCKCANRSTSRIQHRIALLQKMSRNRFIANLSHYSIVIQPGPKAP